MIIESIFKDKENPSGSAALSSKTERPANTGGGFATYGSDYNNELVMQLNCELN
jgi:hypothetical protein